jgi:hypothetical protein
MDELFDLLAIFVDLNSPQKLFLLELFTNWPSMLKVGNNIIVMHE